MKKVKEVMANDVVTASPEMTTADAAKLMLEEHVGCLVVMEDSKITGIITDRDLMICVAQKHDIQNCSISNHLSSPVITVPPNILTIKLAKLMAIRQIKRVPITEQGKLIGIISFSDIAKEMDEQVADMWSEWLELVAVTKTSAQHCRGRRIDKKPSHQNHRGRRLGETIHS